MEWQPIETAPKDGTPVDLWVVSQPDGCDADSISFYCNGLDFFNRKTRRREGRVTDMRYEKRGPNEGWYKVGGLPGGMAMVIEPTHFMYRPEAPND